MRLTMAGIPVRRFVDKLGVRTTAAFAVVSALRIVYELPLWLFSSVGRGPFFAPAQFPWLPRFEAAFPAIRAELETVLERKASIPNLQEIAPDQAVITDDDRWRTFVFFVFSSRVERNCLACPDTMRALQEVPGVRSAMFSILEPGKHIPPHRGPFKGI
ncbi:MAG TPA: aspartyl/asparaginyl beta-hydroxylase domain-containing protein, partial [Vicinamibacteria bacterium]|nr:aspartyl/asparaginyl beta-hydroxylase domain-containing protein [Vicinamibacteria bacterium]